MSLFRSETSSQHRLYGDISLAQPLSIKLVVGGLISLAVLVSVFLLNSEYSRKETVRGFLMPSKGVIKSFAREGGTIEKLLVKEGERVFKGQPLVVMTVQKTNADGFDLSERLVEQLSHQLQLLEDEIAQHQLLQQQDIENINDKKMALKKELIALQTQSVLAEQKLTLLYLEQKQLNELNQQGFVSIREKERQQQSIIDGQQEQQNIARLLLQKENELNQVKFDFTNVPVQYTLKINNLKREQTEIERELARVKNSYQYTISASSDGQVTGIQAVEGETFSATTANRKPLLSILPKGSELVAELLLPTRSAGFVKLGDNTKLRFDAFPYQRFGFIQSKISRIDRALISPEEVQLPIKFQESVYRLQAKLSSQYIQAYGQSFNLKSGMLFEADILLEKRSLIEWLLEPIYSLKGKVG